MAKGGNHTAYTEDWFLSRGYTKNRDGSFSPPLIKSDYIREKKGLPASDALPKLTTKEYEEYWKNEDIIQKEKVNNASEFEVKPVTEWFIPYQVPSKKNSRQVFAHPKTGKMVNIPSKAYKDYITATKMYWEVFGKEFRSTVSKLDLNWPLNIEMTFTRKTHQIIDYFGPGESVFDLMTDFNWWPDDDTKHGKPFFGDMIVDKHKPGVKIKIMI